MAVFRHEVMLPGCSRDWFERFVAEAHNNVEAQRFEGGRLVRQAPDGLGVVLVAGQHATKGARYQVGPAAAGVSATIDAWERTRETGITVASRFDGALVTIAVKLRSADRPEIIETRGAYRDPAEHWLVRQAEWRAKIHLTRWWDCLAGARATPAVVEVFHPLFKAKLEIVPRPAEGVAGRVRWAVDVTCVIRGRSWARPLVAVTLPLARRSVLATYRKMLDGIASNADPVITARTEQTPREAAGAIIQSL